MSLAKISGTDGAGDLYPQLQLTVTSLGEEIYHGPLSGFQQYNLGQLQPNTNQTLEFSYTCRALQRVMSFRAVLWLYKWCLPPARSVHRQTRPPLIFLTPADLIRFSCWRALACCC